MSQTLLKSSSLKILFQHRISLVRPLLTAIQLPVGPYAHHPSNIGPIKFSSWAQQRSIDYRRRKNITNRFDGPCEGFLINSRSRLIHNSAFMRFRDDDSKKSDDDQNQVPGSSDPSDPPGGDGGPTLPIPLSVALSPLQIPEFLPRLPVVAINRNPLFPFFIKMLEVRF